MIIVKRIAVAVAAIAVAAGLAGCAAVPGSVEEQLWFDKAQGEEIHHVSPQLRVRGAIGYPRTDYRIYRRAAPLLQDIDPQ